ncbi:DUF3472 domain-containing protein [Hwangdonia seohaensis]|uniref:DUF3472 domain-containing protein n=1 Tax=Hwangdonia seohaensis TaxID=1240727 RepID=A0ABW3RD64_9FLAO|nr:DUF5077 domain-containing protein [Hwangdonia seohaensis]
MKNVKNENSMQKRLIMSLFFVHLFASSCLGPNNFTTVKNTEYEVNNLTTTIPIAGNSWIVNDLDKNENISNEGLNNWMDFDDVIRTYFHTSQTGKISVGLHIKTWQGASVIKVTVGDETKEIEISNTTYKDVYVGEFTMASAGYHHIDVQAVSKEGTQIGNLKNIKVGGPLAENLTFIKDESNFYFGRRGPSVHLIYQEPAGTDITWFYNEITVPEGNDVIGSYYMANGFSNGYFGMQVNSETERRVLFSVWSAFDTQDPNLIPDEYKVIALGHGSGVHVGEFGNEGSGAQSYMKFNWKPEATYKFLLKGESKVKNTIDYTAYFYAPEVGDWKLIASFRKPKTNERHITRTYSFLENFTPNTGYIEREVNFNNQWIYDTQGNWTELTSAKYSADATARNGVRLDYDGGSKGHSFYLRNCGFFSDNKTFDVSFSRLANKIPPIIDFSKLEYPKQP